MMRCWINKTNSTTWDTENSSWHRRPITITIRSKIVNILYKEDDFTYQSFTDSIVLRWMVFQLIKSKKVSAASSLLPHDVGAYSFPNSWSNSISKRFIENQDRILFEKRVSWRRTIKTGFLFLRMMDRQRKISQGMPIRFEIPTISNRKRLEES